MILTTTSSDNRGVRAPVMAYGIMRFTAKPAMSCGAMQNHTLQDVIHRLPVNTILDDPETALHRCGKAAQVASTALTRFASDHLPLIVDLRLVK